MSQTNREVGRELVSRLIALAEYALDAPLDSVTDPRRRNGNISKARWAVAEALIEIAGWGQPRVGELFNQADHTSVNKGRRRARELLRTDPHFFAVVEELKEMIAPCRSTSTTE